MFAKRRLSFFTFSLCYLLTQAQVITFEKYYDLNYTESGYCVQQTTDGGYIIAGRQGIWIADSKAILLKTDSLGQMQWFKIMGGPVNNEFNSVQQTSDGGYIVAGQTTGLNYPGDNDIYLVKTDANGDSLWTKRFEGRNVSSNFDYGYSVQQTTDGGYIIGGRFQETDTTSAAYLLKTNATGDSLWAKLFRGEYMAGAYSVQQTSDSGYVLAGTSISYTQNGERDAYLIKTNQSGDSLWTKQIGDSINYEVGVSVRQTADGGYFICGNKYNPITFDYNFYVVKTDVNGDTLWTKSIGGIQNDGANFGMQTTDGGYIIVGSTASFGAGSSDAYLIKMDGNGNVTWTKTFGGIDTDGGSCVRQTYDGGYIVTGNLFADAYLIKTDSTGYAPTGIHNYQDIPDPISIYPNPSNGLFAINCSQITDGLIKVYDMLGENIYEAEITNQNFEINLMDKPKGIYLFVLLTHDAIYKQKIIIR